MLAIANPPACREFCHTQVAAWKSHKAACRQRQQAAEAADMEAHIAGLELACGGGGGKVIC